jgi:hypothetical protein
MGKTAVMTPMAVQEDCGTREIEGGNGGGHSRLDTHVKYDGRVTDDRLVPIILWLDRGVLEFAVFGGERIIAV